MNNVESRRSGVQIVSFLFAEHSLPAFNTFTNKITDHTQKTPMVLLSVMQEPIFNCPNVVAKWRPCHFINAKLTHTHMHRHTDALTRKIDRVF